MAFTTSFQTLRLTDSTPQTVESEIPKGVAAVGLASLTLFSTGCPNRVGGTEPSQTPPTPEVAREIENKKLEKFNPPGICFSSR